MKTRKVIQIVKHKPTGAEIPMEIKNVNSDNIIDDFSEYTERRKHFTLEMLQERWNISRDDALEILKKYQVPAHVDHQNIRNLPDGKMPVDVAIFFEEYIEALEKKSGLNHSKLKSRFI